MSGTSRHPNSPSAIISEEAAANIAKITVVRSSSSSFQLFTDPAWSNENYTREKTLGSWKSKKPSRPARGHGGVISDT